MYGINWEDKITSEYGFRFHPITGLYTHHNGLDIGVPAGTEIHACMSGKATVINSGNAGLGLHIIIENGQYKTVYGHCQKALVESGQDVKVGDIIGLVGSTGNSTGPHLHLEYYVKGIRKNPKTYLLKEQ